MSKVVKIILLLTFLATGTLSAGWQLQNSGTSNDFYSIVADHSDVRNRVWACGDNGIIVFTSNAGATWTQQNSGTTNKLYSIAWLEVQGAPLIAVGENGLILRTTNDGQTWNVVPCPVTSTLRYIADNGTMICGDNGVILKSTNNGATWVQKNSGVTAKLNVISDAFLVVAAGDGGVVVRSNAIGDVWTQINPGVTSNFYALPMFHAPLLLMGENGLIRKSSDFGSNWFTIPAPTNRTIRSYQYSQNNNDKVYAVCDDGVIMKSTNQGNTWGFQVSGTTQNLHKCFFYLADWEGWACGEGGVILKTTDGGGQIFPTEITNTSTEIPDEFELKQNYPNPFNPSTNFEFRIADFGFASLKIFDVSGKETASLLNEFLQPGSYSINWNAIGLSSGIYFYTLSAGSFKETKRMMLVK
ncbi:MAG TPA: YCF48-related protein [Ignavibacteria bacterium]|nr:YCF48-related protein [Ignavibacteria bacterium]